MNGMRLTLSNGEAYELIIEVASGGIDDVPTVASVLERSIEARTRSKA
jgi:death on curing protein